MTNTIVTGAASELGMMIVKGLGCEGHRVFACISQKNQQNRDISDKLITWSHAKSVELWIIDLDCNVPASVTSSMGTIIDLTSGKIDVLINADSPDFHATGNMVDATLTNDIIDNYVSGVERMINGVLPCMHSGNEGLIITLSSLYQTRESSIYKFHEIVKYAIDITMVGYFLELARSNIHAAIIQGRPFLDNDQYRSQAIDELSSNNNDIYEAVIKLLNTPNEFRELWNIVSVNELSPAIKNINIAIKQFSESFLQESIL